MKDILPITAVALLVVTLVGAMMSLVWLFRGSGPSQSTLDAAYCADRGMTYYYNRMSMCIDNTGRMYHLYTLKKGGK